MQAQDLSDFLAASPPGSSFEFEASWDPSDTSMFFLPEVKLHCDVSVCRRTQIFRAPAKRCQAVRSGEVAADPIYVCGNCQEGRKLFSLYISRESNSSKLHVIKVGEYPPFGPPTSAKLITLVGPDRESFLKGRRCESQGLGIGAFAYYRRIVENQKNRIFDEMIRVAKTVSPTSPVIAELESAKNESQFAKAIEGVKTGLPDSLFIHGHNPLKLLHSALSEGIHADDDDDCLDRAQAVRTILGELADRMAQSLRSNKELTESVARLTQKKSKSGAGEV